MVPLTGQCIYYATKTKYKFKFLQRDLKYIIQIFDSFHAIFKILQFQIMFYIFDSCVSVEIYLLNGKEYLIHILMQISFSAKTHYYTHILLFG